ncbi:MAG TPA: hypothetical protein PLZ43_14855 [bacterium]|nr:hypothetical protein [bacterium]
MSWHRLIRLPAKKNIFFHYTIESYDNMGLVSTLEKDGEYLILECSTPLSNARFFDRLLDKIYAEVMSD